MQTTQPGPEMRSEELREFLWVLRACLMMLVHWIDKRYPPRN